jgi:hypothetical protein
VHWILTVLAPVGTHPSGALSENNRTPFLVRLGSPKRYSERRPKIHAAGVKCVYDKRPHYKATPPIAVGVNSPILLIPKVAYVSI